MLPVTRPIAATTSLSILLHGAVFVVLVLVYEQAVSTGQGLDIELIRSTMISSHQETELPRKNDSVTNENLQAVPDRPSASTTETLAEKAQKKVHFQPLLTSLNSSSKVAEAVDTADSAKRNNITQDAEQEQAVVNEGKSVAQLVQSTNATQQQHSILELLHSRISDNKEYPYIARRQRREGIATVGFVLHPNGSIENARLVTSSNAGALDRAALSAVKRIEPFKPAKDYLNQSEEFRIDVVFNLL